MNRNDFDPDSILDSTTEAIRTEPIDPSAVDSAAARVRSALAAGATPTASARASAPEHVRGCEDVVALVPAYLAGELGEARRLLFEDHTRECIPCRKALKAARTGVPVAAPALTSKAAPARQLRRTVPVRWAVAAALVVAFGILPIGRIYGPFGSLEATVYAADGSIYRVEGAGTERLDVGAHVESGDRVRTPRDAGAVIKLEDGTTVELRERSELAVTKGWRSTTVRLDRGDVIVRAASSGSRVYVATPAALVTANGATVAIASGTKGTRVTAVEGTPRVSSGGVSRDVAAGEQFTSSEAIEPVPAAREVAWSRDASAYSDVLATAASLRKEIDAAVLRGEPRTSTRLLDLAPADTVFYAAIPNLSAGLADANALLDRRLAENPQLAAWYAEKNGAGHREQVDRAITTLAELGAFVGPEIAVAVPADANGGPGAPVVLAEVADVDGFRSALERRLSENGDAAKVRVVEDLSAAKAETAGELTLWAHDGVVAASPNVSALERVAAGSSADAKGPFFARLAEEYRVGVGFLLAADVQKIFGGVGTATDTTRRAAFDKLGVSDMRYFVVKQSADGASGPRAVLTFDGERRGVAKWLAAPGPVGALAYVSPDANVVAAFSVDQPAALVDDLLSVIGSSDPSALESLHAFEAQNGVSLRDDVAASLGGEFVFAVDGPLLPTPSWKAVLEVNDPARLQAAFEHSVDAVNRQLAAAGKPSLTLATSEAGGRASFTLTSGATSAEVHYTYADGYLIAGPSTAIVEQAIGYREAGTSIVNAPHFTEALPSDGQTSFSAFVYHDLSQVSGVVPGVRLAPTLAYAYAREDRIEFGVSGGDGSPLGLSPAALLGLPGSGGLRELFQHSLGVR